MTGSDGALTRGQELVAGWLTANGADRMNDREKTTAIDELTRQIGEVLRRAGDLGAIRDALCPQVWGCEFGRLPWTIPFPETAPARRARRIAAALRNCYQPAAPAGRFTDASRAAAAAYHLAFSLALHVPADSDQQITAAAEKILDGLGVRPAIT
jgi:hypothetical protein